MKAVKRYVLFLQVASLLLFSNIARAKKAPIGLLSTVRVLETMLNDAPVEIRRVEATHGWLHVEIVYRDAAQPLLIDLVSTILERPHRIAYFIPGGTSFRSSFFTPTRDNLAHHFRRNGRFVVGITPREALMTETDDVSAMADFGLAKHRDDIRRIVEKTQSALDLPYYELLGYSIGGEYALDYAATYPGEASAVTVLGLESFDPIGDADDVAGAALIFDAACSLMADDVLYDNGLAMLKGLTEAARLYPMGDSGESREALGLPGNFTIEGLVYFSAIHTGSLPGFHTTLTGLPGEWWNKSHLLGTYSFAPDPYNDSYEFALTEYEAMTAGVLSMESGLVPLAVYRDNAAVNAHNGAYIIDWEAIDAPVTWINAENGMGNHMYAASRIEAAGTGVDAIVIPDFGHADLTWSDTAKTDVWPLLAR